jgi:hypothetical protein
MTTPQEEAAKKSRVATTVAQVKGFLRPVCGVGDKCCPELEKYVDSPDLTPLQQSAVREAVDALKKLRAAANQLLP